jgi:hypothetical protein
MTACIATKADGTPCQASPTQGSEYCFFHDPSKATARKAAQHTGGRAARAKMRGDIADAPLGSAKDAAAFLALIINQLRRGEIDSRTANGIGYLTGMLLKAIEAGDVSERLDRLEAVVTPFRGSASTFEPFPFRLQERE